MADKTAIEWTDATWSPIAAYRKSDGKRGWACTKPSAGCKHCYAEGINKRLGTGLPFTKAALADVRLDLVNLDQPTRWRAPRRIFVESMSDLFGEFVPDEMIRDVFLTMAMNERHTFQVLTKRSARARELLTSDRFWRALGFAVEDYGQHVEKLSAGAMMGLESWWENQFERRWFRNIWIGASTEDQPNAEERIRDLIETPAARRFLSYEPALGPLDILDFLQPDCECDPGVESNNPEDHHDEACPAGGGRIHWVIAGGESGVKARPAHPDWFRSVRDQCAEAGVPFFHKQNGEYSVVYDRDKDDPDWRDCDKMVRKYPEGRWLNLAGGHGFHGERVLRIAKVGKKRAGRELDGRTHDEFPEAVAA